MCKIQRGYKERSSAVTKILSPSTASFMQDHNNNSVYSNSAIFNEITNGLMDLSIQFIPSITPGRQFFNCLNSIDVSSLLGIQSVSFDI